MPRIPRPLRPNRADRGGVAAWVHLALLALGCVAFLALGARWIRLFRSPPLLDIDEAGYQVFALNDYFAWTGGGWSGWWDAVLAPSIQAPVLTASTTPFLAALGPGALVGLLVPLAYAGLTLAATWWLARETGSRSTAWLAWALCAAAPVLIVYSRHYSFGTAAAATTTLALAALARSHGLTSTRWALAAGLFLGLVTLSRTVMLAMIPGILLAMLVIALLGPDVRRRLVNLVLASVVAAIVAAPWYVKNGAAVFDYLTSFGYGARSVEYGNDESVLSAGSWLRTTQYVLSELGVVLFLLLVAGVLLLLLRLVRPQTPGGVLVVRRTLIRRTVGSPLFPSAVFLAWSLLVLTSTGNKGTGFIAPLVPVACVLAAAGIGRSRLVLRRTLTVAAVCCLAVTTVAYADARSPLADRRTVVLPVVGESLLLDGAGRIDVMVRGVRPEVAYETPALSLVSQRAWGRATDVLARKLDRLGGTGVLTAFGFRHYFVHANAVQFAQLDAGRPHLWLDQISPPNAVDVEAVGDWLDAVGVCLLVTAPGRSLEIEPAIDQELVTTAAKEAGYTRAEPRWRLPNGRAVVVWRGPTC